jgi:hypothetical protein
LARGSLPSRRKPPCSQTATRVRRVGLLSFTFLKLFTGKRPEISPLIWVLSVLFL